MKSDSSQFLKSIMYVSSGSIKITFFIHSFSLKSIHLQHSTMASSSNTITFFLPSFSFKSIYHTAMPEVLTQCFVVLVLFLMLTLHPWRKCWCTSGKCVFFISRKDRYRAKVARVTLQSILKSSCAWQFPSVRGTFHSNLKII